MEPTSNDTTRPTDHDYDRLLHALASRVQGLAGPLFTTDAAGLFDLFLAALPPEDRQHYTCRACRQFVDAYGGLVTISPDRTATPPFWTVDDAPAGFVPAVARMAKEVRRAKVTGVFLSSDATLGRPTTGPWRHLAAVLPAPLVYRASPLKTAGQASAEKREDYGTLQRGLAEFGPDVVTQAVSILQAEALYRGEKVLGVAKWIGALHLARATVSGSAARENVTWLAVATAPVGFCHVRSTMIGTLLEDIATGLSFDDVKRKFGAKMHPTQYQRPQAPPAAGNIAAAEKAIEALRTAGALARRYARLGDVSPLWTPPAVAPVQPTGGPVFGHLKPKDAVPKPATPLDVPPVIVTWEKFARVALPDAVRIECLVPAHGPFYAFATAVNPDAPPVLQWDREDNRNPVSWYTYSSGSAVGTWSISAGWRDVPALVYFPFMRDDPTAFAHQGPGVLVVLDGARDKNGAGACLFPEIMRSEYHAFRSTIEAFSRGEKMAGKEESEVCGLGIRKGQDANVQIRVTPKVGPAVVYKIDRWD